MTTIRTDETWRGRPVRLVDKPGKSGVATGRVMESAHGVLIEIDFGPGEVVFKPADLIEPVEPRQPDIHEHLSRGRFGEPQDLRDLLTLEKLRGRLTNVFYSMESSNTDFYPHQFKSVLRFVESAVGRLLIADEVGLGKTIEAIYIWKELQAREGAQRLLVVCPAMLREKWRRHLRHRFGIDAQIVTAPDLRERIEDVIERRHAAAWAAIASLEGLRPDRDWEDDRNTSERARLARLLDSAPARGELPLDLVVIDEAHALRNPETLSHRLGRLLRDASRHLVLLTATPIHLGSIRWSAGWSPWWDKSPNHFSRLPPRASPHRRPAFHPAGTPLRSPSRSSRGFAGQTLFSTGPRPYPARPS